MDISDITGKYPGCCWKLNAETVRISYKNGHMTRPNKTLPPPLRSLWTDPTFVLSLTLDSLMSLYVGSSSNLVNKGIGD